MTRLNVRLKDSIYDRLVAEAEAEGRSVSDVVRVLVNNWVQGQAAAREYQKQIELHRRKDGTHD